MSKTVYESARMFVGSYWEERKKGGNFNFTACFRCQCHEFDGITWTSAEEKFELNWINRQIWCPCVKN